MIKSRDNKYIKVYDYTKRNKGRVKDFYNNELKHKDDFYSNVLVKKDSNKIYLIEIRKAHILMWDLNKKENERPKKTMKDESSFGEKYYFLVGKLNGMVWIVDLFKND